MRKWTKAGNFQIVDIGETFKCYSGVEVLFFHRIEDEDGTLMDLSVYDRMVLTVGNNKIPGRLTYNKEVLFYIPPDKNQIAYPNGIKAYIQYEKGGITKSTWYGRFLIL